MKLLDIHRDWEVFASEGAPGIGAVRQVSADHATVYIEGYGDIRVTPDQIASVHDGKVLLDVARLAEAVQTAIRHAHDRETR